MFYNALLHEICTVQFSDPDTGREKILKSKFNCNVLQCLVAEFLDPDTGRERRQGARPSQASLIHNYKMRH